MIISIVRDWGMDPSIVRIVTDNSLTEVGTTNYIYDQRFIIYAVNGGQFQWNTTDMVLVYSTSDAAWGYFTITPDFKSLTLFESMAGTANAPINTNITDMRALQCIQSPTGENNLCFTYTPNAVNYLRSTNSVTLTSPILSADGSDTNVNINLVSKGNGTIVCETPLGNDVLRLVPMSSTNMNAGNFHIPVSMSGDMEYTFQAASGTIAFTSDIPSNDFVVVSGTSQIVAENKSYIANNAGLVTFTIPASFGLGKWFYIVGGNLGGGWRVQQTIATHQIKLLSFNSTLGIGGIVNSTNSLDGSLFVCMVANDIFNMQQVVGNPDLL